MTRARLLVAMALGSAIACGRFSTDDAAPEPGADAGLADGAALDPDAGGDSGAIGDAGTLPTGQVCAPGTLVCDAFDTDYDHAFWHFQSGTLHPFVDVFGDAGASRAGVLVSAVPASDPTTTQGARLVGLVHPDGGRAIALEFDMRVMEPDRSVAGDLPANFYVLSLDGSATNLSLFVSTGATLQLNARQGNGAPASLSSGGTVTFGVWAHYALTVTFAEEGHAKLVTADGVIADRDFSADDGDVALSLGAKRNGNTLGLLVEYDNVVVGVAR